MFVGSLPGPRRLPKKAVLVITRERLLAVEVWFQFLLGNVVQGLPVDRPQRSRIELRMIWNGECLSCAVRKDPAQLHMTAALRDCLKSA